MSLGKKYSEISLLDGGILTLNGHQKISIMRKNYLIEAIDSYKRIDSDFKKILLMDS